MIYKILSKMHLKLSSEQNINKLTSDNFHTDCVLAIQLNKIVLTGWHSPTEKHTHTHIHTRARIYAHVCVCGGGGDVGRAWLNFSLFSAEESFKINLFYLIILNIHPIKILTIAAFMF